MNYNFFLPAFKDFQNDSLFGTLKLKFYFHIVQTLFEVHLRKYLQNLYEILSNGEEYSGKVFKVLNCLSDLREISQTDQLRKPC